MKKVLTIVLIIHICCLSFSQRKINDLERKLETIIYPDEINFKGTLLHEALTVISKKTEIKMVPSAEIADLPVYLRMPANQSLKNIIKTLKIANDLVSTIVNDTLIIQQSINTTQRGGGHMPKILGKVTEEDGKTRIKGVALTLGNDLSTFVLSDVNGSFLMHDVLYGTYELIATKYGYFDNTVVLKLNRLTKRIKISLVKKSPTVNGTIYDYNTLNPIKNAAVFVGSKFLEKARTDENGGFLLYEDKGLHTIEIKKRGYILEKLEINIIDKNKSENIQIYLFKNENEKKIAFLKKEIKKKYPYEIDYENILLSSFVEILRKETKVKITVSSELSKKRVNLFLPSSLSIEQILTYICDSNELKYKFDEEKVIIFK